ARESLVAQLDLLAKEKRSVEAERAALEVSIANWQSNYASLDALQHELGGLADKIDEWGYAQRRKALLSLRTRVVLHPAGHEPRVELSIRLPVSGRLALGLENSASAPNSDTDPSIRLPADGVKNCVSLYTMPATMPHKQGYCA
ncbi:MAG: hypothetical protein ACXVCO_06695, partial [Ktedonobacterales bacterium]